MESSFAGLLRWPNLPLERSLPDEVQSSKSQIEIWDLLHTGIDRGTQTAIKEIDPIWAWMAGAYEAVEGGFAHHGMLKSAQWLLEREGHRLRSLLQQHPGSVSLKAGQQDQTLSCITGLT